MSNRHHCYRARLVANCRKMERKISKHIIKDDRHDKQRTGEKTHDRLGCKKGGCRILTKI